MLGGGLQMTLPTVLSIVKIMFVGRMLTSRGVSFVCCAVLVVSNSTVAK